MSFEWNGDKILRKRAAASLKAVNQTMAAAVKHAKLKHPGWKNVPPAGRGWTTKTSRRGKAETNTIRDQLSYFPEWRPGTYRR